MRQDLFETAILMASENIEFARKNHNSQSFSYAQRKILKAYVDLRTSSSLEIEENLGNLSCTNPTEEGLKYLVMGISKNNIGKMNEAVPLLMKADEILKNQSSQNIAFLAVYNLFIVNQNLSNIEELEKNFLRIRKFVFEAYSPLQIRKLRVEFNWSLLKNDYNSAEQLLSEINSYLFAMNDYQKFAWTIDKIRYYVQTEELSACSKEVDNLKIQRNFYLSPEYKFLKAVLGYLTEEKPFYLYLKDFKDIPLLAYQTEVLLLLEEKKIPDALVAWEKLSEIYPNQYLDNFQFKGEKCLFSLAFQKLIKKTKQTNPENKIELITKEDKLYHLIISTPDGISKEEIYKIVWQSSIIDKADIVKMAKLINRIKVKYQIEIKSKKGTYYIAEHKKSKSA